MKINFLNPRIHMSVEIIVDVNPLETDGRGKPKPSISLPMLDRINLKVLHLTQKQKIICDFKRFRVSPSQDSDTGSFSWKKTNYFPIYPEKKNYT